MFINSMTSQGDVVCSTKSLSSDIHPDSVSVEPCCPLLKRKETVSCFQMRRGDECVGARKKKRKTFLTKTVLKKEKVRVVDFKAICTTFHQAISFFALNVTLKKEACESCEFASCADPLK